MYVCSTLVKMPCRKAVGVSAYRERRGNINTIPTALKPFTQR